MAFSGPCKNLKVTGMFKVQSPRFIHIGNQVLLKTDCELMPGSKEKSIMVLDHSEIHERCVLRAFNGHIHIGRHSSINREGIIYGAGGVTIGDYVRIGPRANIVSANHNFRDPKKKIMEQGLTCKPVTIKDDTWLGINVTILPGVTVGTGSIIAAGAVITHDVEDYSIYAGVPGRKIGER
jgi:acetyltransferase-like isoleucine patch superfamily enzyme